MLKLRYFLKNRLSDVVHLITVYVCVCVCIHVTVEVCLCVIKQWSNGYALGEKKRREKGIEKCTQVFNCPFVLDYKSRS